MGARKVTTNVHKRLYFAGLCWAVIACGDSTAPDYTSPAERVPRLGLYDYTYETSWSGTVRITFASADSIAAEWNVPQFSATPLKGRLGFWNNTAYYLQIPLPSGAVGAHRIARQGDKMICGGRTIFSTSGGGISSDTLKCSLKYRVTS